MTLKIGAVFLPGVDPSGRVVQPITGQLACPHCGDLYPNPEDGYFNTWTWAQVKALAAMSASRVCSSCGKPSSMIVDLNVLNGQTDKQAGKP